MKKTIQMIGNAHLDPVWLWQWREGYHEIKATFQAGDMEYFKQVATMNKVVAFLKTCVK